MSLVYIDAFNSAMQSFLSKLEMDQLIDIADNKDPDELWDKLSKVATAYAKAVALENEKSRQLNELKYADVGNSNTAITRAMQDLIELRRK